MWIAGFLDAISRTSHVIYTNTIAHKHTWSFGLGSHSSLGWRTGLPCHPIQCGCVLSSCSDH